MMRIQRGNSEFFQRVKKALEAGICHVRGEIQLRTIVREMPVPPPALKPRDIVKLRQQYNMTQDDFARVVNVSPKTVQSWEQGERTPSRASLRLLQIMASKPDEVREVVGIGASRNGSAKK